MLNLGAESDYVNDATNINGPSQVISMLGEEALTLEDAWSAVCLAGCSSWLKSPIGRCGEASVEYLFGERLLNCCGGRRAKRHT